MRYPGKAHDERYWRTLVFVSAVVLFVGGLLAAKIKLDADTKLSQPITSIKTVLSPSPKPTDKAVRLRLTDQRTEQPISNQEVTFFPSQSCDRATTCQTISPVKTTTTDDGELLISGDLIGQKPQLYVVGYKMDRYFTILDANHPNQISLYYVTTAEKVTYDTDKEILPVALIPVD